MEVLHHGGTSMVVFAEGPSMGLPIDGVEDIEVPVVSVAQVSA